MWIGSSSAGRRLTAAFLLAVFGASGCGTLKLYDQSKETAAKEIKTQYAQVQLLTVMETERKNLDALLQEELTVLREARKASLDHDLLALVDGDRPIGYVVAKEIKTQRLRVDNGQTKWKEVTIAGPLVNRAAALAGTADGIAGLRQAGLAAVRFDSYAERVRERAASIAELTGGTKPPPCDAAEFETALDTFVNAVKDPKAQALVRIDAGSYRKACNDAHRVVVGDIGRAAFAADAGGAVTKARAEEAAKLNERLKQAADEYAAAVKVVKAADTNQTRKHLQDATAKLKGALNSAAKGLSTLDLEVLPEARVQAIDYILSAVASGQVNAEKVTDPDFARAAAVAGDVPSQAGTIAIMVRKASSPSVSDLLIEKEHQLLLREYALRRTAFAEHRAALHEARYRALVLEGDLVVANHDALCNFMEKQAGIGKRVDCDTLRVTLEQPVDAPVAQLVACEFALGRSGLPARDELAGRAGPGEA
jgi:prefoldin subunit 5